MSEQLQLFNGSILQLGLDEYPMELPNIDPEVVVEWVEPLLGRWMKQAPEPYEAEFNTEDYQYLGVSSWQKAIRRGDADTARVMVEALYHCKKIDSTYLWNRLAIIAMEDVGVGDVIGNVVIQLIKGKNVWRKQYGDRALLQLMSYRLAKAPKDRNSCELMVCYKYHQDLTDERMVFPSYKEKRLIRIATDTDVPIEIRGLALHCLNGTYVHKVPTMNEFTGSIHSLLKAYDLMNIPKMLRFVIRKGSYGQREGHHICLGLIWNISRQATIKDEVGLITLGYIDEFPSVAFDKHTREGKKSCGYWKKADEDIKRVCKDQVEPLGSIMFRVEGHQVDRRLFYEGSEEIVAKAHEAFLRYKSIADPFEAMAVVRSKMDDLHKIRKKIYGV